MHDTDRRYHEHRGGFEMSPLVGDEYGEKTNYNPFMPVVAKKPPRDTGRLVYMIMLLNGIGVLMPWNMFITIAPQYYVDYWFTQNGTQTTYAASFMSSLGIASQLPNVLINVINIFLVIGGSLLIRIAGPLVVNCISVSAVISLIFCVQPSMDDMGWFYVVTLVIVAVINLANGLYQNSIFGLAADFPWEYTNALILGNNMCGIFTTVLSMLTTMLFRDNVRLVALIYFGTSLCVLILCGISLWVLTNRDFYQYHVKKGNEARAIDNTDKPGLAQYINCFKSCWVQLWNVFFIFFVTLTIFPAMMVATPLYRQDGEEWTSIWPENLYVTITTFLCFNVFATVGSTIANFVGFPVRFLWIPVLLRGLLIPFFMFCNYRPIDRTLPVIFESEWIFLAGGIFMALSSGYLSSRAMMSASSEEVVDPSLAKIAGMSAALCLILGIFAGVSFTLVVAFLTTSF